MQFLDVYNISWLCLSCWNILSIFIRFSQYFGGIPEKRKMIKVFIKLYYLAWQLNTTCHN